MRDLQEYAKYCINELYAIGIKCGTVTEFSVNTRAKHRWGQTKHKPDGTHTINISYRLLDEKLCESDFGLKNTLIHELLHTVEGCHGHTGLWKTLANKVNMCYGYGISRCSSAEEKGVAEIETPIKRATPTYNYKISCEHCGKVYLRQRMSKAVQHPEAYRCGCCGGKLKRIY